MKKIIISGHLGKDATVNEVNGRFATNFSVATNESYRDADNKKFEKTTWFSCSKWSAENPKVAQYLTSGTQIIVEGIPEPGYYKNNNGEIVPQIEIRVLAIELLGTKKDNNDNKPNPESSGNEGLPQ